MRYEADGRFHQVRSANTEPAPSPLDASHPVILRLMTRDEPIELDPIRPTTANSQKDHFGDATQAVLCVPIRNGDELIAFVALSCDLHGERYGTDDGDLLRAISHHVGVLLSQASLAEERRGAAGCDRARATPAGAAECDPECRAGHPSARSGCRGTERRSPDHDSTGKWVRGGHGRRHRARHRTGKAPDAVPAVSDYQGRRTGYRTVSMQTDPRSPSRHDPRRE